MVRWPLRHNRRGRHPERSTAEANPNGVVRVTNVMEHHSYAATVPGLEPPELPRGGG